MPRTKYFTCARDDSVSVRSPTVREANLFDWPSLTIGLLTLREIISRRVTINSDGAQTLTQPLSQGSGSW